MTCDENVFRSETKRYIGYLVWDIYKFIWKGKVLVSYKIINAINVNIFKYILNIFWLELHSSSSNSHFVLLEIKNYNIFVGHFIKTFVAKNYLD